MWLAAALPVHAGSAVAVKRAAVGGASPLSTSIRTNQDDLDIYRRRGRISNRTSDRLPVELMRGSPDHAEWARLNPSGRSVFLMRALYMGDAVPAHDHDFYEIVLITGGRGLHQSIYGTHALTRGDVIIVAPGGFHSYRRCEHLALINVCFQAQLVEHELLWILDYAAPHALLSAGTSGWSGIVQLRLDDAATASCEEQVLALEDDDWESEGAEQRDIGRILVLVGILAQHADHQTIAVIERALRAPPWLLETARLVRERYNEPWRLDQLAGRFAVDPSHLSRVFKATFGLPPIAYLTRTRNEAAAALLLGTDRSISEISTDVGWPDSSYFARRFRAHFGVSPTRYRRTQHHIDELPLAKA